jgi:hypothetical protein
MRRCRFLFLVSSVWIGFWIIKWNSKTGGARSSAPLPHPLAAWMNATLGAAARRFTGLCHPTARHPARLEGATHPFSIAQEAARSLPSPIPTSREATIETPFLRQSRADCEILPVPCMTSMRWESRLLIISLCPLSRFRVGKATVDAAPRAAAIVTALAWWGPPLTLSGSPLSRASPSSYFPGPFSVEPRAREPTPPCTSPPCRWAHISAVPVPLSRREPAKRVCPPWPSTWRAWPEPMTSLSVPVCRCRPVATPSVRREPVACAERHWAIAGLTLFSSRQCRWAGRWFWPVRLGFLFHFLNGFEWIQICSVGVKKS